jgi:hypothetical protein
MGPNFHPNSVTCAQSSIGCSCQEGVLSQLLQNPIFVGKVKHGDQLFAGEHDTEALKDRDRHEDAVAR